MPAPYTNIQFLAYELYTGPQRDNSGKRSYRGLADDGADIKARCAVMERAMARALKLSGPADPSTLKVFMAPEFFFRGVNGAYPLSAVMGTGAYVEGASVDLIGILQGLARNPDYADWIFVFGTILATPDPEQGAPVAPLRDVYNFALVQTGGIPDPEHDIAADVGARIVMKKFKSHIDFIKQKDGPPNAPLTGPVLYDEAVRHLTPYDPGWSLTDLELASVVGGEQQLSDEDGGAIFVCQGVTFGMEICLDHNRARLWQAQLPGQRMVQVQLVPSGGSYIDDANKVSPGGMVFACDGLGWGTGIRPNALGMATGANVDPDPQGPDAQAAVALFQPLDGRTSAAGRIEAYRKAALPAPVLVPGQVRNWHWVFGGGDIMFSLIYDAAGKLSAARCRMGSSGGNKNHLLYTIPLPGLALPPGMLKPPPTTSMTCVYAPPSDPADKARAGKVTLSAGKGSDGRYVIGCDVDLDSGRFEGTVMRLYPDLARGAPETVDGFSLVAP